MASLAWPLERNQIRREIRNNAFGMVRNGGTRPHQGWDLSATPGTPCYAIADGKIMFAQSFGEFGNMILLEFEHRGQTLYAAYCHLSMFIVMKGDSVKRGGAIGYTGNTGNARSMQGEDQHLHFEIRTAQFPGTGLGGRIDPATLYGHAPVGWTYYEAHGQRQTMSGLGLKVPGVNVREHIK
jgi:murein DD-endopeptidase MepM/ murein hydrolase activator NlpD